MKSGASQPDEPSAGGHWANVVLCSEFLGGAEIFALERLRQISGSGRLYCNDRLANLIRAQGRYENVPLFEIDALAPLARRITWRHLFDARRALDSVLARQHVLMGNLRASALQLVTMHAGRHTIFIHDNTHYLNAKTRWLLGLAALRSNAVLFPCRHASERLPLRRMVAGRLHVEHFAKLALIRRQAVPPDDVVRIVNVGRIEPNKNQKFAVEIVAELVKLGRLASLTLLGPVHDPVYMEQLRRQARDSGVALRCIEKPRSEVPSALSQHHLVLHSSLIESLPLVLFEANAAGRPFFALPTGGLPEVLPPAYFLSPNPQQSAAKLHAYLDNGLADGSSAWDH